MQVQYILTNWHIPNHSNHVPVGPRSGFSCRFPTFTRYLIFCPGWCFSWPSVKAIWCENIGTLKLWTCAGSFCACLLDLVGRGQHEADQEDWEVFWGRSVLAFSGGHLYHICCAMFVPYLLVMINTNIKMTMIEIIYLVGQLHIN